ncbi:MAG: hypothetical protein ABI587_09350 [Gemmatimonadales bacterium]
MNRYARAALHATALISVVLAASAEPLNAQDSIPPMVHRVPGVAKYGKWALLAAAVGMGLKASSEHHAADHAFDRLKSYCFDDPARCDQQSNGHYLDPVSEGYYQTSIAADGRARRWLLGGEGSLLASAGLFVWELTRPKHPPKNIPFEPTVEVVGPRTHLGLQVPF